MIDILIAMHNGKKYLRRDDYNIQTSYQSRCYLCGTKGKCVYQGLRDLLFEVPGEWNLRKCANPECGLLWLDPMPQVEDIPKLYTNYHAHSVVNEVPKWILWLYEGIRSGILAASFGYKSAPRAPIWRLLGKQLSHIPLLRERIGGTAMWLQASQRGRLLDIGCGNGKLLRRMRNLGWDVVGVEPDHYAASLVKSKFHLDVHEGFLEQARFPDGFFDAVTMNHVIEHLHDPIGILKECRRILRKGGYLVLVTPNTSSLGIKRYGPDWRGLEPPRHLYLFSPQNIQRAILNVGLILVSVTTLAKSAPQVWLNSDSIRRKRLCEKREYNRKGFLKRKIREITRMLKYPVYQVWDCISLSMNPNSGEEILVIAKKP